MINTRFDLHPNNFLLGKIVSDNLNCFNISKSKKPDVTYTPKFANPNRTSKPTYPVMQSHRKTGSKNRLCY